MRDTAQEDRSDKVRNGFPKGTVLNLTASVLSVTAASRAQP